MRTAKTVFRPGVGAQADLSLRWALMSVCRVCRAVAHLVVKTVTK